MKKKHKLHMDKKMISIGGLIAITTLTQVGCGKNNPAIYASAQEEPTGDPGYAVEIYGPKPIDLDENNTTEEITEEETTEENTTIETTEESGWINPDEEEYTTMYGVAPYKEYEEYKTEEITEEDTEEYPDDPGYAVEIYGPKPIDLDENNTTTEKSTEE